MTITILKKIREYAKYRAALRKERAYADGYAWAKDGVLGVKRTLGRIERTVFTAHDFDRGAMDAVRDLAKFDWVRPSR